jgi:hypothetical protein
MSTSQPSLKEHQHITRITSAPSPPPTDKKAFTQASRIIALFKDIEAGRHVKEHPWTEFQLLQGEYDDIERQLRRDEALFGYTKDKIRCVALNNDTGAANDGNLTGTTTTQEATDLLSACQPIYMSSSLIVLRIQFEVS